MQEVNVINDSAQMPATTTSLQTTEGLKTGGGIKPARRSYSRFYGRNEVLDGEYKLYQKLLGELIGTTFFVFGVCSCCVFYGEWPIVAVLGSSFMGGVIIYIFGRVSGAHFNPAVSLALYISKKLSTNEFLFYVLAQIIGSIIGCILLALCRRGIFEELAGNEISGYLIGIDGGTGKNAMCYISSLISEILGTFILIMVILASCERDNYLGPNLGLAFSVTLISLNVIGGRVSSCSLNPARSLGPALVQLMAGGDKDPIKQIWIYLVGPLLGAAIAAFVWPLFFYAP